MSEHKAMVIELDRQIKQLQDSVRAWKTAGLPEKTLLILLNHSTKIPQKTIRQVLWGIENLDDYLTDDGDE